MPGLYLPPVFKVCHLLRPRRSFHCRSRLPCERLGRWARWWCWWLSNYPCSGLYLPPVFRIAGCYHIRPRRSFHCRSRLPCEFRASGALVVLVAVQLSVLGLYLPPVFKGVVKPTPDDHFTAGPHCRVIFSGSGRIGGAGGCPTIRAGIVSPAGVQIVVRSHQLRPRRSFHCRSTLPCDCIGQSGALVVLVAVQLSVLGLYLPPVFKSRTTVSAPNDHFTAGPHCRVTYRPSGGPVVAVQVSSMHPPPSDIVGSV